LPDPAELELELSQLTENTRLKRREALKELAGRYRTTVNALYRHLSGRQSGGH
jgi:hypothetical protein